LVVLWIAASISKGALKGCATEGAEGVNAESEARKSHQGCQVFKSETILVEENKKRKRKRKSVGCRNLEKSECDQAALLVQDLGSSGRM